MYSEKIIPKIKNQFTDFTKTEMQIGNFILENSKQVTLLSLSEFSKLVNVGEASIIRFCRKLSVSGYPQLKMLLAADLKIEHSKHDILSEELSSTDSLLEISKKISFSCSNSLEETYELFDEHIFKKAITAIEKAKKILFVGSGFSNIIALEAAYKFVRVGIDACAYSDPEVSRSIIPLLSENDVVIAISQRGETLSVIENIKRAKKIGASIISITNEPSSSIAKLSNIVLINGFSEGYLQGGALGTRISQSYIIEVLYSSFVLRHKEKAIENKEKTL